MFIWTIGDAIGAALLALGGVLFGIIWAQDWLSRRRRARQASPSVSRPNQATGD